MPFTYESPAPPSPTRPEQGVPDRPAPRPGFLTRLRGAPLFGPSARRELPDFTRQLATLLQAGTNTPDALETLRRDVQSRALRDAVAALEVATKRGLALHAAMRMHPGVFDRVYTEIVAAGERSGTLERMLDPLAAGLVSAEKIRGKVSRAMIQPAFSLLAALLGGWYMIQKVVPTFAGIYEREGVELPALTRTLIAAAELGARLGDAGLVAGAAALLLLPRLLRAPGVRVLADRLVLRLPIVGPLARLGSLASFLRTFSTLLATEAIPEAEAIELAARTAPNAAVSARLATSARDVAAGNLRISAALERTGLVPALYVQILRTGEATGQVTRLARYGADRLEERVMDQVERAQAAVVPLATALVIAVVATILIGLYGPMTGLYEVLLR